MGFCKNDERINRKGRPTGSGNTSTAKIKDSFQELIENNLEGLQSDLESLKPFERLKMILELAAFVLPKQKAIEVTDNNIDVNSFDWEKLFKNG